MDKKGDRDDVDEARAGPSRKHSSVVNSIHVEEDRERANSISDAKTPELGSSMDRVKGSQGPPTMRALQAMTGGGYNQTYLIMRDVKPGGVREVFFRCGQWCYKGDIEFFDVAINTAELPTIIPTLQRQQGKMKYFCPAGNIPVTSCYYAPMSFIEEGIQFISSEIVSDKVERELKRWSKIFRWIEEDAAKTYFELMCETPDELNQSVELIANKTYNHGLIIISIFHQNAIYFVLQDGEGDQPLLDVSFPNVSRHGQGLLVANYFEMLDKWKKLTLWHNLETKRPSKSPTLQADAKASAPVAVKKKTVSVASKEYMQTYCIRKASPDDLESGSLREVLFRFGSWCYAGEVQLIPSLSLLDVPFVIPALRMQQSRLNFLCDTAHIPEDHFFAPALQYMLGVSAHIDRQIADAETTLGALVEKLTSMGVGDSVAKWLQGDSMDSFFEFKVSLDDKLYTFRDVELLASKSYRPGVVTITIVFQQTIYVSVQEVPDDNPLLDSRFPDVSGKGRGYQLQTYDNGIEGWRTLQKVSVWQTVSALEEEFRDRTAVLIQNQSKLEHVASEATAPVDSKHEEPEESKLDGAFDHALNSNDHLLADSKDSEEQTLIHEEKGCRVSEEDTPSESSPFISGISASDVMRSSGSILSVSRPHHLPKMETLSKKVEELRKALENNKDIGTAPWDNQGQPLMGKSRMKK